jgi:thiol:disulfide interchange protein
MIPQMHRVIFLTALVLALFLQPGRLFAQTKYADASTAMNSTALHPGDKGVIAVVFDVADGFHAQSHTPHDENLIPCNVTPEDNPAVTWLDPVYPPGKDESYPQLGVVSVYTGRTIFYLPFTVKPDAPAGALKLSGAIHYQACDDKSCFAPQKTAFVVEAKVVAASEPVTPANADLFKNFDPKVFAAGKSATSAPPPVIGDDSAPKWSLATALAIAFFAGMLFNVMPCVLPVLPLKAASFYEVAQHHRSKTLLLATVFSLGLISVFAVLAVVILVLRKVTWGEQFSNPYFAWGIVILLLVMSLAMFGAFAVLLPKGVYELAPRHDTYLGNFGMGILTAVLSTPCTAPLFPPLMLWASAQPLSVGVPAMLMVGVGMAFPYVLLSAFPEMARRFPRVGPWSELVKQMMGFLLLGAAVFFASGQLLHGAAMWWPMVGVAAVASLYLMGRSVQLSKNAMPVAVSAVLAVLMVGSTIAIAVFMSTGGVNWTPYSDDALAQARAAHKIVLVKFTANWCLNCQTVEATVYHDETAIRSLQEHDVVMLKADLSKENAAGWPLLKKLNPTGGIPLTAIYAPDADQPIQISSVYTTQTLLKVLDQLTRKSVADAR